MTRKMARLVSVEFILIDQGILPTLRRETVGLNGTTQAIRWLKPAG